MEELMKNKLMWVIIGLFFVGVVCVLGKDLIIDKISDAVLQKIEQKYSPSPYGPTFDPDKVQPKTFTADLKDPDWLNEWEKSRGFNRE